MENAIMVTGNWASQVEIAGKENIGEARSEMSSADCLGTQYPTALPLPTQTLCSQIPTNASSNLKMHVEEIRNPI